MSFLVSLIGAIAACFVGVAAPVTDGRTFAVGQPLTTTGTVTRLSYPWHVTDTRSSPGAICTYDGGSPRRRVFVPVHMPLIYWPDTHAGRTDGGTVGWQIELQVASSPSGPWRIAYTSSVTRGTASEHRAARVAKHAINWRVLRGHAWYRVRDRAIWYRSDGSRVATRTHFVQWYRLARALSPWQQGSPGGWNIGRTLGLRRHDCPSLL